MGFVKEFLQIFKKGRLGKGRKEVLKEEAKKRRSKVFKEREKIFKMRIVLIQIGTLAMSSTGGKKIICICKY